MSMFFKKPWALFVLVLPLILLGSKCDASGQKKDLLVAKFEITTDKFLFHGPILIFLTITNLSSDRLGLGTIDYDLKFSAMGRGNEPPVRNAVRSSVGSATLSPIEIVKPHSIYRRPILLDQYLTFDSPGQYHVNCAIDLRVLRYDANSSRPSSSTKAPTSNMILLTLIDDNESYISNTLIELTALIKGVNNENKWQAAKTLCNINHPLAIPYLVGIMDIHPSVSDWSIKGLGQIGTRNAVKALIDVPDIVSDTTAGKFLTIQKANDELKRLLKTTEEVSVLVEMLRINIPNVRFDVLCKLRDKGNTQCAEFAKGMLIDPNPEMRKVAEKFLKSSSAP